MYVQHYNEAKYARNFTMAFALRTISDKLTSHLRKLIVIWVSIQSTGNAYRGEVTLTVNSCNVWTETVLHACKLLCNTL